MRYVHICVHTNFYVRIKMVLGDMMLFQNIPKINNFKKGEII